MDSSPRFFISPNNPGNLLAIGAKCEFEFSQENDLSEIDAFLEQNKGEYIFGWLSYDLKNKLESLESKNEAFISFPLAYFFVPQLIVRVHPNNHLELISGILNDSDKEAIHAFLSEDPSINYEPIVLEPQFSKNNYLEKIEQLKGHIQRGDIYEITFCQDFRASEVEIEANYLFHQLNRLTQAPMSAYVERNNQFLLCGSPERFLQRKENTLLSQPIKGTAQRSADETQDEALKQALITSDKEQSENVMIVDLVRNDLSRIAEKNSVNVDELFGIYSFPTVHQMISSISATVKPETRFSQILRALFPMGSMTGAPKIKAMQIIEEFEEFQRGIFSGAVGFIEPNGDFDFNVVIRSILYDQKKQRISCPVGSAITIKSKAEDEYNECLLKVEAMKRVLNKVGKDE